MPAMKFWLTKTISHVKDIIKDDQFMVKTLNDIVTDIDMKSEQQPSAYKTEYGPDYLKTYQFKVQKTRDRTRTTPVKQRSTSPHSSNKALTPGRITEKVKHRDSRPLSSA